MKTKTKLFTMLLAVVLLMTMSACGKYTPTSFEADGEIFSASVQNGNTLVLSLIENEEYSDWRIIESPDTFKSDYENVVEGISEFHIIATDAGQGEMRFECKSSDGTVKNYLLTLTISRHQKKYLQIDDLKFLEAEDIKEAPADTSEKEWKTFKATVLEKNGRTLIVQPVEGSLELSSADKFSIPSTPDEISWEPAVGNIITVSYTGDIMETYPAQLGGEVRIGLDINDYQDKTTIDSDWQAIRVSWIDSIEVTPEALNPATMTNSTAPHVPVFFIDNKEALDEFKSKFSEKMQFDFAWDDGKSFNQAVDELGEDFFENNALVIGYVSSGSGSLRYGVVNLEVNEGSLCLNIEQLNHPEAFTDDMATWLIIAPVSKNDLESIEKFDAKMVDNNPVDAVETIEGFRTYNKLRNGTWECDGYFYKYRLEISGRIPNAAKDSTFVYLSNIEEIPFEKACMAAGISSNSNNYFSPEEAVLVEMN